MSEQTPEVRLQPFLLDRLRDDAASRAEGRGSSMRRYREALLRDLRWLLNAKCHGAADGLGDFPLVERSVVNYGLLDLTGMTASEVSAQQVELSVKRAIEAFEPRIIKGSLTVQCTAGQPAGGGPGKDGIHVIALEIRGQMWAQPAPETLYIKTEVDLETGTYQVS
jgi:type VI secretion system protein ImpF